MRVVLAIAALDLAVGALVFALTFGAVGASFLHGLAWACIGMALANIATGSAFRWRAARTLARIERQRP